MAKKTRINKEINEYTLRTAVEEFYKHNRGGTVMILISLVVFSFVICLSPFDFFHLVIKDRYKENAGNEK